MCFLTRKEKTTKQNQKSRDIQKSQTVKKAVKLILCGHAAVGKTFVIKRYIEGVSKKNHEPTLAGSYYQEKQVKTKTGQKIQINIWDLAGYESFRSIMPLYYRDAEIALLVFDLTNPESFVGINYWLGQLEEKVKTEDMFLCLIGNKKDLDDERRVSKEEGILKANERKNCIYYETSALTGQGIEQLFQKIIDEYMKREKI